MWGPKQRCAEHQQGPEAPRPYWFSAFTPARTGSRPQSPSQQHDEVAARVCAPQCWFGGVGMWGGGVWLGFKFVFFLFLRVPGLQGKSIYLLREKEGEVHRGSELSPKKIRAAQRAAEKQGHRQRRQGDRGPRESPRRGELGVQLPKKPWAQRGRDAASSGHNLTPGRGHPGAAEPRHLLEAVSPDLSKKKIWIIQRSRFQSISCLVGVHPPHPINVPHKPQAGFGEPLAPPGALAAAEGASGGKARGPHCCPRAQQGHPRLAGATGPL